jgi:flagellar biosynthesis protein FliP
MKKAPGPRCPLAFPLLIAIVLLLGADRPPPSGSGAPWSALDPFGTRAIFDPEAASSAARPPSMAGQGGLLPGDLGRTAQTMVLFGLLSMAPAAVLMTTSFVRISIVLTLLRQALGSPQVPGNQVVTALALLLTALVMKPTADLVYARGIEPYRSGQLSETEAWEAGTGPIKQFMVDQVLRTHHERYLEDLYRLAQAQDPGGAAPQYYEQLPLRVVAPAYLLSELTTALWIGFLIYLPFLVIDLVVSAVLAAMGLIMLPPSQVAMPLKLVLFVLADGWWLVAEALLRTFAIGSAGPGAG